MNNQQYEKKAILFCPDINGHRQVYACVVADWYLKNGFGVIFCAGRSADSKLAIDTPLIGMLAKRPGVVVLDLGDTKDSQLIPGSWVRVLKEIEERYSAEWTFLPVADGLRLSLDGLGRCTTYTKTKRAAIFAQLLHGYWPNFSDRTFIDRFKHWYGWQKTRVKEERYFRKVVWDSLGLDVAFCINQHFFRGKRNCRFHYLPDIYRAWDFELAHKEEQIDNLCKKYNDFLAKHPGKEVLLYFGNWDTRKGYDKMLYLTTQEPNTLFVCYRWPTASDNLCFQYDINRLRSELKQQERIFEIESSFLPENAFFELLYTSCNFLLLPYDNYCGLSGNIIRATVLGKPVLVPSIGYLASLVRQYRMGLIYRNNDYMDFRKQFHLLRKTFPEYQENAKQFGRRFDKEKVYAALTDAILGHENKRR